MTIESHYHFQLAKFECVSLGDDGHNYSLQSSLANFAVEHVQKALRHRNVPSDGIWSPYTCLFVNTGEHRVLVEMGAGSLFEVQRSVKEDREMDCRAAGGQRARSRI